MEIQIKIIGYLLILLAMIHFTFPKQFSWKKELAGLSLINKQLMEVHTFFVAFVVFLMGLLCITSADELIHTVLGNRISLGMFIFWGTRLIFQFLVYSPKLWKGKTKETIAHIIFSLLWIYLSVTFLMAANLF